MTDENGNKPSKGKLNPELRQRSDTTHDTSSTAAPLSKTGAKEGSQGEGWSILWLVATIVSVALTLYLIL